MWAFFLLTFAGLGVWVFSALRVEQWLSANDPEASRHAWSLRLPARLVASFRYVRHYGDLRAERNEDMLLVSTYFGGLATAVCGFLGLLLSLVLR
jgi:hypothetical protein